MAERPVDFAALGRVSSRAELKTIRLTEVTARCDPKTPSGSTVFEAKLTNDCQVVGRERGALQVACNYRFTVQIAEAPIAQAMIKYLLDYDLRGIEPIAAEDIEEFAFANGTLHSWPFVREFIYGLTVKMGYPPYTLPVVHFVPKPPQKQAAVDRPDAQEHASPPPKEAT